MPAGWRRSSGSSNETAESTAEVGIERTFARFRSNLRFRDLIRTIPRESRPRSGRDHCVWSVRIYTRFARIVS
ncbi:MAG: hypothetical protein CMJ27_03830 [Phycisphaerae bacterium]|nr:hypothetical protein [Phycisphaerae bacterium]